jgi:hypothetical protein
MTWNVTLTTINGKLHAQLALHATTSSISDPTPHDRPRFACRSPSFDCEVVEALSWARKGGLMSDSPLSDTAAGNRSNSGTGG